MLGDASVGKTSLLLKYSKNTFIENYKPTLGADFIIKEEKIPGTDDQFHLYLWDLAGNPTFAILRQYYMHGANGAIVAFDLGVPASFQSADTWLKDVYKIKPQKIPVVLIGTKGDLPQKVPQADIDKYVAQHGLVYLKTSSKTGENVHDVFLKIIQLMLDSKQN